MKKLATIFLILIYFTFSAGAVIHLHYCMGEFVNFSLAPDNTKICDGCGMESHGEKNGCCKDVQLSLKISDDYYSSSIGHTLDNQCKQLEATCRELKLTDAFYTQSSSFFIYYPPPREKPHLYLKNRNLRV